MNTLLIAAQVATVLGLIVAGANLYFAWRRHRKDYQQ
jgi:biopolymer transport protein ExbB/TolQ